MNIDRWPEVRLLVESAALLSPGEREAYLDAEVSDPEIRVEVEELRGFLEGAELIIHNAPFDIGFMDVEFALLGLPRTADLCGGVIDTLVQAKQMFPGKRNSLDALCDRFGISNAHRTLHGALLDSELLAAGRDLLEMLE